MSYSLFEVTQNSETNIPEYYLISESDSISDLEQQLHFEKYSPRYKIIQISK
jgi:hypothetical protein